MNGPTGMVYNPGTALSPAWYDHFFIAEFRGSPANSPVHAFKLKPKGASFELDTTYIAVKGLLPTGLDFGPDGALYMGDWIDGWGTKDAGRIWKLDVAGEENSNIRRETKGLIEADFGESSTAELSEYLSHQDMRIRQKAQFELVGKGRRGYKSLLAVAQQSNNQLARIHALWGIGQLSRKKLSYAKAFEDYLTDDDTEIVVQAAKMIGDVHYEPSAKILLTLLEHSSLRVRLHATEALGRIGYKAAVQPILTMLEENNDEDAWLRHAGVIALGRIGEEAPLTALASNPSVALRTAAVVALRRMKSPSVAAFLSDEEEFVATEAARAVNDDYSIEAALPALANALTNSRFSSEPFVRRAINANVRVGTAENIDVLMAYVKDTIAPPAMRAEALISLGTWGTPSVFDRVDGRYRGPIQRDSTPVIEALRPVLAALLTDEKERIQIATAEVASRLQVKDLAGPLYELFQANPSPEVKVAALEALQILEAASLETALEAAFNDRSDKVRSAALSLLPASKITPAKAIELFRKVMRNGTTNEKQATLAALGEVQSEAAVEILGQSLQDLQSGRATPDIQLDIIEAIEAQNNSDLVAQLADYQANKPEDDPLAMFSETLAGGDAG
ncbi:MAG: HEAT repeat domain-containing protein, partial [Bacteroidota bacterium]